MFNAILDANVVIGYFNETVRQQKTSLTEQPSKLLGKLATGEMVIYLDVQDNIEHEWKDHTDREWAEAWLANLYRDGQAFQVDARPQPHLEKKMRQAGFPNKSRDKWYVRASVATVLTKGKVNLVSEDLDFYDPAEAQTRTPTGGSRFSLVALVQ